MKSTKSVPKTRAEMAEIDASALRFHEGRVTFHLVGRSPLIYNRLSEKAKRDLLYPRSRKTRVERAGMKHDPVEEYRNSVYRARDDSGPTRLVFPAPALKQALASAALDTEGFRKTEIMRLTWVRGQTINIFGVPQIYMAAVRSADMNKTPDIRTRAIVPEWAGSISICFASDQLNVVKIGKLLSVAGMLCGIGDFRQQKGAGAYGQFGLVDDDDGDYVRIIKSGGRAAQDAALANPVAYDADTEELLAWFEGEKQRRAAA